MTPTIKVRRTLTGTHADIEAAITTTTGLLEHSLAATVTNVSPGVYAMTGTCFGPVLENGKRDWLAQFKVPVTFTLTKED